MMNKTRPFLKWAGSKYNCLDNILSSLPSASRLIEPFTGSGAVFINSSYSKYLLGEQNNDLVILFQHLQKEGFQFIDYCAKLFSDENNCAEKYYQFRAEFNQCKLPRRRASLFLYLNRHGYNGLCRYNMSGLYNVPFGRYPKPYFPRNEMVFFHEKCKLATFLHSDFRQTFALATTGDIIYCDPPYVPLSKSANFSSYTEKVFSQEDQIELAQLALKSAREGITVIISNHDTPFTRYHYQQGDILSFPVQRHISCNAFKRHTVQELVAVFKNK